ncbi:Mediator of RNA polymerase II transcription subunit 4 [Cytospora mali]|uniref:Mediator of RNA polymerase II transcription subunit 4 n=1 Tax=Cytospora mali TaxID=578113 RepID=A0A194VXN6_CYTMA|nr:Mediator of RNA polymerase II transcription subunit 4 [Valsa mali]
MSLNLLALANLVESITKYTPQASQAADLAAADRELGRGLRQLEVHQNNHQQLEALKAASSALDAQIRDTLRTLWTTRKDITSTVTTVFPDGPHYDVNYEELLSYARRISKMTMPPPSIIASYGNVNGHGNGVTAGEDSAVSTGDAVNTPTTTAAPPTPVAGGASTPNPNAMTNGAGTPAPQSQSQSQGQPGTQTTATSGATALPAEWTQFLDPLTGHVFVPWAQDEKVRVGALASIQHLLEQGIDPRSYDPAEEEARRQREEEERRGQEEKEAKEHEEVAKKMREEQARIARERQQERERALEEAQRRGSTGGGPSPVAGPSEPQKRQFQFMGGDLDDDDDD